MLIRGNSTVLMLRANITLMKPSPQNDMWPKRVMRLRKEEYPPIHPSWWKNNPMMAPEITPASMPIHPARRLRLAISIVMFRRTGEG
jgi:hypothetical protein